MVGISVSWLSCKLQGSHKPENLENSGNLKNCQDLRENSGRLEFFVENPGKLREDVKYVT